jgi:hypothetical protein
MMGYPRADAAFSTASGNSTWTWLDVTNPFGTAPGDIVTVGFD